MPTIQLPDIPKNEFFEDYVASIFKSSGYYADIGLKKREGFEVTEVDVVATCYDHALPSIIVIEAKSGDWHMKDIMALLGQKCYLKATKAAFFVHETQGNKDCSTITEEFRPLGLAYIDFSASKGKFQFFEEEGFPALTQDDELMMTAWRYAHWIERVLFRSINAARRTSELAICEQIRDYYNLIHNEIFFEPDVTVRLERLYDAYRSHPRLARNCAQELGGDQAFKQTLYGGENVLVQSCFWLEHRARLSILKAAIDYVCQQNSDMQVSSIEHMPNSFCNGLAELRRDEYFTRYAIFWQTFLWVFGGFILHERQEEEFGLLSKKTGIPPASIPRALEVFDILFPKKSGKYWIRKISKTAQLSAVTLMPWPFLGLGAHLRKWNAQCSDFNEITDPDTAAQLQEWAISAVQLLS